MTDQTENPTPSAQDDIKTVLQDTLIEQAQTLLKFTGTEAFALQVPDTETHIMVGPRARIAAFLGLDAAVEQPTGDLPTISRSTYGSLEECEREQARRDAALASQSQAAQPSEIAGVVGPLESTLEEMQGIVREGSRWGGNEQIFAAKEESDVAMLDDFLSNAFRQLGAIAAHLAGQSQATKAQAEPVARLMHWTGPKRETPFDGICARTFSEFPKGAGENGGYWKEGDALYAAPVAKEALAVPMTEQQAADLLFEGDIVTALGHRALINGETIFARLGLLTNFANKVLAAAPQAPVAKEAPTAWLATDLDGRGDVGFTKEEAKRRAGEGCTEFFPLYDLPVASVVKEAEKEQQAHVLPPEGAK